MWKGIFIFQENKVADALPHFVYLYYFLIVYS